jgi:predicted AlkP superfamily pyrophosphatase or phosphodiesterase
VLVGVDGLEWDVLLPLLRQERLPALAGMMEQGRFGRLESFVPTESPAIWTSVATGKMPEDHGILAFTYEDSRGRPHLYTSEDRTTKALWSIATDYGKRVCVVGWWMTYPVEPVNGVMVAQTNTDAQLRGATLKGGFEAGMPGQVHPVDRQDEVARVFAEVEKGLDERVSRLFGNPDLESSTVLERNLLEQSMWAFRADAAYDELVRRLSREAGPFDLTLVYFGGPDVVGHRFWRYREPRLYDHPPTAQRVEDFGSIIDDYYVWVDEALGRMRAAFGKDTTFLLVSDHGMKAANFDGSFGPSAPPMSSNSALHEDAPPGVIVATGPLVRPGPGAPDPGSLEPADLPVLGSVLDIAPSVLFQLDLPVGSDMVGDVLRDVFLNPAGADAPTVVPSHDPAAADSIAASWERERLDQLRGLGYID